jgi:hypothetical protein
LVGIVDLDPVLGVKEAGETTQYVEPLALLTRWIRTGLGIGYGSGELPAGCRQFRA